jgi:hypothetical protein
MSQILMIQLGLQWFRDANKYIENLYQLSTSKYGTITVKRNEKDDKFIDEFDFIIKNMGL